MNCRHSKEYSVQVFVAAFTCILSCLIALGQVSYGGWLIYYLYKIVGLLGALLFNLSIAFTAIGAYGSVIAIFGVIVLVLRRRRFIILHIFLTILCIVGMCVIWAMVYLEQRKVSTELPGRLVEPANVQYYTFINHQYNCNLTTAQPSKEIQSCSDFVARQTWIKTYAILGLIGGLICVQSVIVLMEVIISRLLKQLVRTYPIGSRNPLATDLMHTNPAAIMTPEDVSEGISREMSYVEPSAPPRPPSSPSLTGLPPLPFNPAAVSPPFYTQNGFLFSSNHHSTWHSQARPQRQPSITQL